MNDKPILSGWAEKGSPREGEGAGWEWQTPVWAGTRLLAAHQGSGWSR